MSKKTGYLLGILLTIIIGMILAWFFCCKHNTTQAADDNSSASQDNSEIVTTDTTPTRFAFDLKDPNGSFAFNSTDNFDFNGSEFNFIQPLSEKVNGGIDQLQAYLSQDDNSKKYLDITGFYTSKEANPSAFPNLGIARANAVKNYLVSKGIPSNRLNTIGTLNDKLVPDGTIYRGPVGYRMYDVADDSSEDEELEALKARINADPLVLYFGNAEASIELSATQRQKIADISHYLDKVAGSSIDIEGHTDNTGSRTTNTRLGRNRAGFIKSYFVSNGISESKINTSSKGPDEPVATNETEEGRSKNRRSIVTLN